MTRVRAEYWRVGEHLINFGEHLAYLIPEYVFGTQFDSSAPTGLMTISSELHRGYQPRGPKLLVWGAGTGYTREHILQPDARWEIHAVRNSTTRDWLGLDVPVGDPSFFSGEIWQRQPSRGAVLLAPHWHAHGQYTHKQVLERHPSATAVFDVRIPCSDIYRSIEQLLQAEFVLAGAMHVLLFCISLGIPCAPYHVVPRNKPIKWDHMQVDLGVDLTAQTSLQAARDWWDQNQRLFQLPDLEALRAAYPIAK